jgi:hypothetical protein
MKPEGTSMVRQKLGKHFPAATNTQTSIDEPVSMQRICKYATIVVHRNGVLCSARAKYGDGVEYLHRSLACRRRRREGKSRIRGSKIWSRVPGDLGPRITALTRASSNYKRQTCPLVRERARDINKIRNCLTVIKIWSWSPDGCFIARKNDLRSQCKTRLRRSC